MQHYEIVLLMHPEQNDQVGAMMERYRALITGAGGTVHATEDWGRRQLASPVRQVHKARYLLMSVECETKTLAELEQVLRFNDAVLRSLVIARDEPVTTPSLLAQEKKERERKQKSRARAQRKTLESTDETEATADAETAAEAEVKADAETAAEAEATADAETAAEAEAKAGAETAAEAEVKADAETAAEAEAKAGAETAAEAEAKAGAETAAEAEVKAGAETAAEAEAKAGAETAAEAKATTETAAAQGSPKATVDESMTEAEAAKKQPGEAS